MSLVPKQSYIGESNMYIPERFSRRVEAHLLGNYARIENYPLIMCIVGEAGMGKTWQLRRLLDELEIRIYSVDASRLEDELAGRPAKYLKEVYVDASSSNGDPERSAVVIDDFDTTVGEWEQNTGTVNHQAVLAFLMHVAEDPSTVGSASGLKRVPIFITANYAERIYKPLIRFGRADVFNWKPSFEERAQIIGSILNISTATSDLPFELAQLYESEPISFFSHVVATARINAILEAREGWSMKDMLESDAALETLRQRCGDRMDSIDWKLITKKAAAERLAEQKGSLNHG